jgi:hypothetical protein
MKKLVVSVALLGLVSFASAQKKDKNAPAAPPTTTLTYVSADAKISKFHTEEELKKLGKIELTALYVERVKVLTEIVPYLALHTKPGATLKEIGIPETETNIKHMEKEVTNKVQYLNAVNETLDDIIPFADKVNIIWSILLYEDILKRAETEGTSR